MLHLGQRNELENRLEIVSECSQSSNDDDDEEDEETEAKNLQCVLQADLMTWTFCHLNLLDRELKAEVKALKNASSKLPRYAFNQGLVTICIRKNEFIRVHVTQKLSPKLINYLWYAPSQSDCKLQAFPRINSKAFPEMDSFNKLLRDKRIARTFPKERLAVLGVKFVRKKSQSYQYHLGNRNNFRVRRSSPFLLPPFYKEFTLIILDNGQVVDYEQHGHSGNINELLQAAAPKTLFYKADDNRHLTTFLNYSSQPFYGTMARLGIQKRSVIVHFNKLHFSPDKHCVNGDYTCSLCQALYTVYALAQNMVTLADVAENKCTTAQFMRKQYRDYSYNQRREQCAKLEMEAPL